MTTEESISKECLICSAPNASVHFGIDACRACSSFFKRARLSGRHYSCRKGNRQCTLRRTAGSICRGCRFDKCTAIGMEYDGPMRAFNPKTVADPYILSMNETSLLDRIAIEHAACVDRRKTHELKLVRLFNLTRLPHPSEEVYLASFQSAVAAFNVTVTESWQLLIAVFPSLKDLTFTEQREFYRRCMPQFAMADCFCRTKTVWGGFNKYSMCSVLMCTDIESPEHWIREEEGGRNREEFLESVKAYGKDQMMLMAPSFEKADICEKEKHAILALLLCESDILSDFSERFQPFLAQVRHDIFHDLHQFYTNDMGLSDYSMRLGRLLTICHTFREGNALFHEFINVQMTIFDLNVTEEMLRELIL